MKTFFLTSLFAGVVFLSHIASADTYKIYLSYNAKKDYLELDKSRGAAVVVDKNNTMSIVEFTESQMLDGNYEFSILDTAGYEMVNKKFTPKNGKFFLDVPYFSIGGGLKIKKVGSLRDILTYDMNALVTCNNNSTCEFEKGETIDTCLPDCASGNVSYSPRTRKLLDQNKGIVRNQKTKEILLTDANGTQAKAVAVNSKKNTDFSFWQITLMIIIGAWFLKTANRAIKRSARRHKQEQAENAARLAQEAYQRNQNAIARARALSNIAGLVSSAQVSAAKLPLSLSNAELWLDQAEKEFSEGVYSPFWEAMEGAVQSLSEFNMTIRFIEAAQQRHALEAPPLAPDAVSFSLGVRVLPNPSATNQRMKALYRQAQKKPHFAQIYEQRRTNAILIEGFRSLGDALNYLGDRIESELRSLGDHLSFRLGDIESSIRESSKQMESQHEKLLQTAQSWREEARSGNAELAAIARSNAENAERSAKERRDMLDNIQHRRKPLLPGGGGGDY